MTSITTSSSEIREPLDHPVIDTDGRCLYNEFWDTRNKNKYPSIYEKALFIHNSLRSLAMQYPISSVFIEQSLHSFRSGFSSAQTLSTLSKINGIVSWHCYKIFKVKPEMIAATSARKTCGIKVAKGQKAKEVVLKYLLDNEPSFNIEYTKHGNPKPGSYDKADSIVIAKAGYILCQNTKNSTS